MYLQSLNSNLFVDMHIANKNLLSSFINIRFDKFLIKYKNICFIIKNPKMLDILLIFSPCFI